MSGKTQAVSEVLFLIGLFATLILCVITEMHGSSDADMGTIINGLMIALSAVGGHIYGKKSAEKEER